MHDRRDFKKEYGAFLKKVPYQTAVVDNVTVRYQYGGKDGTPVILFFSGLEMLKDYPLFKERDFEYLRGRIQVLLPEKDMFKKEDQDRLADLFQKLDAEVLTVPGGHVGFIVQAERYMDLMETFLEKNSI